jgi:hypothetical protein
MQGKTKAETVDPDAIKIGELFREAKAGKLLADIFANVTDTRKSSQEFSSSRNATYNDCPDAFKANAAVCHHCRSAFVEKQVRCPIMTDIEGRGWALASVCMGCFETAAQCEKSPLERYTRDCKGCGVPMLTPLRGPYSNLVCSNRCYQRDYRMRRRGRDSVVTWKARRPNSTCTVCRKPLDQYGEQHKRRDAVYCSAKCRQWAYRCRKS